MSEIKRKQSNNRERIIGVAAGGICLSLAEILSLITVFKMPQGGSITPASMLPIILYGLCFGPKWSFPVAFLYGVLQMINDPSMIVSFPQALMDYIFAFTVLGVSGFFAASGEIRIGKKQILGRLAFIPFWKIFVATLSAIAGRLVFSVLAGIIFYGAYVPEGQHALVYSLGYNASYLVPELLITVFVLFAMRGFLQLRKKSV